ncbi:MAG TPA: hypothetical protein VFX54_01665, partial [Candidatus Binatia bacterium]|nr:hypothetical protein [Candidatus Binatia bacterium]
LADLPTFGDTDAEALNIFAVERRNGEHRHLVPGLLLELRESSLKALNLLLSHDSGVVIHSTAKRRHFQGGGQFRYHSKTKTNEKETAKLPEHGTSF